MVLTDSLVQAAEWTHNMNVNKLKYSPLQLVSGKSCVLLGLTMEYEATESLSDMEAVQKAIERKMETQKEFREAEMRLKLKECQGV